MPSDVETPNPCLLTPEEQINLLAILKKTSIRLGVNNLPTAPSNTPFGAAGLSPNLRINGVLLDTIQNIQILSAPQFARLGLGIAADPVILLSLKGTSTGQLGLGILSDVTSYGAISPKVSQIDTTNYILASAGTETLVNAPSGSGVKIRIANNDVLIISVANGFQFGSSAQFVVGPTGLPSKSNNIALANNGQGFPLIVAVGGTVATAAVASIASYNTGAASGIFEIGGYLDVISFTAGTISMFCTYTDAGGNPQTLTIPLVSLAGVVGTSVGSATDAQAITLTIVTSGAHAITIGTTVTAFTGTYAGYAWIKQIS